MLETNASQCRLITEASRSQRTTHHSRQNSPERGIGSSQTDLYLISNNPYKSQTFMHGIRIRNPSKLSATDPHLRPLGRWDRHCSISGDLHWLQISYFILLLQLPQFHIWFAKMNIISWGVPFLTLLALYSRNVLTARLLILQTWWEYHCGLYKADLWARATLRV